MAIAIPEDWSIDPVPSFSSNSDGFESLAAIIIPKNSEPIKLATCYNHPGHHFPMALLQKFKAIQLNAKPVKGIFTGDFNSPHRSFGSRFTNSYGTSLMAGINLHDLTILNDGEPTIFSSITGEPNLLDLALCDRDTSQSVISCCVGPDSGTDHRPVITTLSLQANKEDTTPLKPTLDPRKFRSKIEDLFRDFDPLCFNTTDIDLRIKELEKRFKKAELFATSNKPFHKRILPRYIFQAIKEKKKLSKERDICVDLNRKRHLNHLYNVANKKVKRLISDFDANRVETKLNSLASEKDTTKIWRTVNSFRKSQEETPCPLSPLDRINGRKTENDMERCEVFAEHLTNVHHTPRSPQFSQTWRDQVDSFVSGNSNLFRINETDVMEPELSLITPIILRQIINTTKLSSAPGEDGISYKMLRMCSEMILGKICHILNSCQHFGYFPISWKHAKVVMLPKPGKDPKLPSSYRPISLLSAVGKAFERFLCHQLVQILEGKKALNKFQAGFRKGRNTQEHILRLTQKVLNGFKQKQSTIAVFLDVKSAFDAVWMNGLKFKLQKLDLPKRLLSILCSFLDNRSLQVWIDEVRSSHVPLRAGTPQGSCLSPTLYIIFTNDLPSDDMNGVDPSQYADDIGIWSSAANPAVAENLIQQALFKIEKWCQQWQITLSPEKTKVVHFSKCPTKKSHVLNLKLFGLNLKAYLEADFLGITFDASLTWESQFKKMTEKALSRLNLLRVISGISTTSNPSLMINLYKSLIRSVFEYGSIGFISAKEVHHQKLQQIQNAAIRTCLKVPAFLSINSIHDASGLHPIFTHLKEFASNRFNAMLLTSPIIQQTLDEFRTLKNNVHHPSPLDILNTV